MTDKVTPAEFNRQVLSFREKMGTKLEPEQYRNIKKMLTITYLNVDQSHPDFDGRVADTFLQTIREYSRRMELMGYEV